MGVAAATSLQDISTKLYQRVESAWTGASQNANRISWPNVAFEIPTQGIWLQVGLTFGESVAAGFSGPGFGQNLQSGTLFLTVYAPKNAGTQAVFTLASQLMLSFNRSITNGPILPRVTGPQDIGDEHWATAQMSVSFQEFVNL